MSDEAPALTALDEQMRASRAQIDEAQDHPARAVTGWLALWSTTRYDDDGDSLFGWTYAVDPNADPMRMIGVLDLAKAELMRACEPPQGWKEDDE